MPETLPYDVNQLNKYGQVSYTDPNTGKMTYVNRIGPGGTDLTPMDLGNPTAIDNTPKTSSIQDMVDALLKGSAPSAKPGAGSAPFSQNLLNMAPTFSSLYKPPTDNTKAMSDQYLSAINAPSSVDEAMKGVQGDALMQTLAGVDRDTAGSLASTKLDMLDRGLGGPGQGGDIEANALAQVRAGGDRTKAGARSTVALADLERQKARENAQMAAYGKIYDTGVAVDTQGRTIAAQGAASDAATAASLLSAEHAGNITQSEGALTRGSAESQNYMNQILNYALQTGKLSQDDAQYYAGLISKENTAAADREAQYQRALLGTRSDQPDFFSGLGESLLTGVASGLGGPIAGGITSTVTNALKKKPGGQVGDGTLEYK